MGGRRGWGALRGWERASFSATVGAKNSLRRPPGVAVGPSITITGQAPCLTYSI